MRKIILTGIGSLLMINATCMVAFISFLLIYGGFDNATYDEDAIIAKAAGFENTSHCSSATPWYSIVPSCIRECIGVLKFWILGN